jgi:cysteinyl-tRNA synthetase
MDITLYDTRTRRKQALAPVRPGKASMYVCGPTVYDRAHIGNARPVVVFDTLFRLLRHTYGEGNVTYVRNITDVEDKINARARESGRSIGEITADRPRAAGRAVPTPTCSRPTARWTSPSCCCGPTTTRPTR